MTRMPTKPLAAVAAAFALVAPAFAQDAPARAPTTFVGGDAITSETGADVAEMIRVADAIDAGVDAKDWERTRSYFTDTITVDFSSLVGGEPATIPADGLMTGWSTNLTEEKTSFHQRSNHLVTFDGPDRATMTSQGYAWNRYPPGAEEANGGSDLWEVWGTYGHAFTRTEEGWKVNAMSLEVHNQRGNGFVRDTVPGS
ncbi:MAG: nuclear transport factor 2 family protein [Pseudomonadota bacterium]